MRHPTVSPKFYDATATKLTASKICSKSIEAHVSINTLRVTWTKRRPAACHAVLLMLGTRHPCGGVNENLHGQTAAISNQNK
jgi:hypothetical protein